MCGPSECEFIWTIWNNPDLISYHYPEELCGRTQTFESCHQLMTFLWCDIWCWRIRPHLHEHSNDNVCWLEILRDSRTSIPKLILKQFLQCAFCIVSCLLHGSPRCHPSVKPIGIFSVGENTSDTDHLLWCATCEIGKLRTMAWFFGNCMVIIISYEKTAYFSHCILHRVKPVVCCSSRNQTLKNTDIMGSDGTSNTLSN